MATVRRDVSKIGLISVTGTPQKLFPDINYAGEITLHASANNSTPIFIGFADVNTVGRGYSLEPGENLLMNTLNVGQFWVMTSGGVEELDFALETDK